MRSIWNFAVLFLLILTSIDLYSLDFAETDIGIYRDNKVKAGIDSKRNFVEIDYYFLSPACFSCVSHELIAGWLKTPKELSDSVSVNIYSNDRKFIDELRDRLQKYPNNKLNIWKISDSIASNSILSELNGYCVYQNNYSSKAYRYKVKKSNDEFSYCYRNFDSTLLRIVPKQNIFDLVSSYKSVTRMYSVKDLHLTVFDNNYSVYYKKYWIEQHFDTLFNLKKEFNIYPTNYNQKFGVDSIYNYLKKYYYINGHGYGYILQYKNNFDTVQYNENSRGYRQFVNKLSFTDKTVDSSDFIISDIHSFSNALVVMLPTRNTKKIWVELFSNFSRDSNEKFINYYLCNIADGKCSIDSFKVDTAYYCLDDDFATSYNNDFYFLKDDGTFRKIDQKGNPKLIFSTYVPQGYRIFTNFDGNHISINYIVNNNNYLLVYNSMGNRVSKEIQIPFNARAFYKSNDSSIHLIYEKDDSKDKQCYYESYKVDL